MSKGPLAGAPVQPGKGEIGGDHYLPSDPATVRWGWLANRASEPVLAVDAGDTVTIDTVSHEGILEDQGRDPVAFFSSYGVKPEDVLTDAVEIAEAGLGHREDDDPHVVTGPIAIKGALPGDLLRVEVLDLQLRASYGLISSRHGYGALPGELPRGPARIGGVPEPVSVFCEVTDRGGVGYGSIPYSRSRRCARFPLNPFLGLMGVAVDSDEPIRSVPPGHHGGNLDVNLLGVGATLYLPVEVPGALFYTGDPHFAQGDGEVALTAFEAPLRATVRLDVLSGQAAREIAGALREPFAETDTHWVIIGLHEDLAKAMKATIRSAIAYLGSVWGMEEHLAYAYLSAAADFEISQVVDQVKGVHCLIRKADFTAIGG